MKIIVLVRDLLVRFVLLVALDQGLTFVIDHTSTAEDADIGAGLLAFAVLAGVAGLGGLVDGMRRPFPHVATVWIGASLLYGVAACVLLGFGHGPYDASGLGSDLRELAPFLTALVAVPALITAGVAAVGGPLGLLPGVPADKAGKP